MSAGFSKIPHGFHLRLKELTGAEIKVWLAHRCREGKAGESYPSLDRLAEDTGLSRGTVKVARKGLRNKGWLTTTGQKRSDRGKFSVPIEHTEIPPVVDDGGTKTVPRSGGTKTRPRNGYEKPAAVKSYPEVDPALSLEEDPERVETAAPKKSSGATAEPSPSLPPTAISGKSKSRTERKITDDDVAKVQAAIQFYGQSPSDSHVRKYLAAYPADDIIEAFGDFYQKLQERNRGYAEKQFFADRAGHGALRRLYERRWIADLFVNAGETAITVDAWVTDHPWPETLTPRIDELISDAKKKQKRTFADERAEAKKTPKTKEQQIEAIFATQTRAVVQQIRDASDELAFQDSIGGFDGEFSNQFQKKLKEVFDESKQVNLVDVQAVVARRIDAVLNIPMTRGVTIKEYAYFGQALLDNVVDDLRAQMGAVKS